MIYTYICICVLFSFLIRQNLMQELNVNSALGVQFYSSRQKENGNEVEGWKEMKNDVLPCLPIFHHEPKNESDCSETKIGLGGGILQAYWL